MIGAFLCFWLDCEHQHNSFTCHTSGLWLSFLFFLHDTKCLFLLSVYKAVCLSFFPFSLFLSSLPSSIPPSLPPCPPAPGSVSSFTEQLKVTGTEREGEGGRDRGRTHHSIAWGYTTVEEEREMEGQREKRRETHKSTHREFHKQVLEK